MEKRTLLAVALSVIVLILYQIFFIQPKIEEQKLLEASKKNLPLETSKTENNPQSQTNVPSSENNENKKAVHELPLHSTINEKIINVETPLYSASFSTKGASIHSFIIKEFKDANGQLTSLLKKPVSIPPMSIGKTKSLEFASAQFITDSQDIAIDKDNTKTLEFIYEQNGITIKRTYKFYGNTYKIDLKDELRGMDESFITLGSGFGYSGNDEFRSHVGPVILEEFKRIEINPKKDLDSPKYYKENVKWAALEDKYFFAAIVPLSGIKEAVISKDNPVGDTQITQQNDIGLITLKTDNKTNEYVIYAGPKKEEQLKLLNLSLEDIIDFGFFSIIAKPIFWLLQFLNHYIGNYGWSIIALTLLLRVPFIPLINKGQSSMKKLQKLQPIMNDIKEKYKKDPQRMQREMMELYKKNKVNPMGGCLPIVIQIPVFFALYKVLLVAIELRGAPFIFWVTDLSAKDPYYVLPIVMGATMFIQQKMAPSGMDPKQAKIMLLMPIIFTFMFLNFSSGLVLYWLCSNLLSIVQQLFVNKAVEKKSGA